MSNKQEEQVEDIGCLGLTIWVVILVLTHFVPLLPLLYVYLSRRFIDKGTRRIFYFGYIFVYGLLLYCYLKSLK